MPSVTLTTSQTWTAPFTGTLSNAEAYGAGGNGADTDAVNGGAGGGGGEYAADTTVTVIVGTGYTVTVGVAGGELPTLFSGDTGGIVAEAGSNAAATVPGAGGTGGTGATLHDGGAGGDIGAGGPNGGGGGSAAYSGSVGNDGASGGSGGVGGASPGGLAGAGGNGATALLAATAATNYGGGGSGGSVVHAGVGAATNGVVKLTWTYPTPNPVSMSVVDGSTGGTNSVTITAADHSFSTGCTVKFGTTPATSVVVVDDNHITCVVPAHAAGAVTVTVTTADTVSSGTVPGGYTYHSPIVSAVHPAGGPTSGGTAVTIAGQYLTAATGATLGGVGLTSFVVDSDIQVHGTTGAHPATGLVTAVVTNAVDSGSLANDFVYFNAITSGSNYLINGRRQ